MDINYLLSCKKMYNNIIYNFENIINEIDDIVSISYNDKEEHENKNIEQHISNILMLKKIYNQEKEKISCLIDECNNNIEMICPHDFVNDSIDISPDISKNICYCSLCGYTC
jgi:hypothetical protein